MAHPDWVLKHKVKNSEIRNFKGKYHLYAITSKWCPEKKRTKKVTLKQIGIIDKEFGLIPTGMSRKGKVPKGASKMKNLETNFMDHFEVIEDPRLQRNQLYTVSEILLVTLLAVICGAEGWQDVENYGKRLAQMEEIAKKYEGVEDAYAFEAGRELRVIINPGKLDDAETLVVATKIRDEVSKSQAVAGEIKVTAIREFRAVVTEFAA